VNSTEEIWHTFHEKLLFFIRNKISDKSYAEDILHDVFLKIHTNIDKLHNLKKIESWIFQITRNTIIDYYRNQKNHEELPVWLDSPEPDETIRLKQELSSCLLSLIDQLPLKYGSAVLASDIEGKPQKDLAHSEHISLSGAKSRIQRGRTLLKNLLHDCCKIELNKHNQILDCSAEGNGCSSC
jgi:RNA polymerase sigma-70 factor, ECF subfamily